MNRKIRTAGLAGVLAAALALAGCSSSGSSSSGSGSSAGSSSAASSAAPAKTGGVITSMVNIATEQPVNTLDPLVSTSYEINAELFDFLTQINSKGKIVADLATSWTPDATDSVWTYKLRPGLTFTDGSPLTASDVAFSFETILNNPKSNNYAQVASMQSATAPDPSTVVFTMVKPNVAWPAVTAQLAVVSQKAYTAEGPTKFATDPLGSGPYSLVSFNPGSTSMVLKANPNWWAGEPKARNVTITQVADATTRLNGLQSGQYDLAILTGDQVATAKGAGLNTYSAESTKTVYVGFNTNGSDTSSLALREAFSYAIDRSALVKTLLSGFAVPTGQLPPPALNNYDPSIQAPAQDIAKAKALVQQSGYSGQTITLEYTTAYVNAANQVAQAIVGYMSAVGVKLKLVVDDSSTFISNWFGKKIPGAYLMSIQSGSPDSASTLTLLDKSAATFTDPTITSLMAQQAVEVDPAARVKLLQQLTQVNNTQAYYVPLYTDDFNFAWSKKISFTPPSNGYLFPTYISGS